MTYLITIIPGDGIGPEVMEATQYVLSNLPLSFEYETVIAGQTALAKTGHLVPQDTYQSIERTRVILKGPITTPIGGDFSSINVHLRQRYDLYANIRPVVDSRLGINLVIFRENTEGLYIGEERIVSPGVYEATKRITDKASRRIIEKAFSYAKLHHLPKVTVVHKANILKITDGAFLSMARQVATHYQIPLEEIIIDNMCMQLVMNPKSYGVIVTMNLYGDILSDLAAGLVGGLGLIPSANIGDSMALFEAVHGSAPSIAGKQLANPIALIRSAVMMLEYLHEHVVAQALDHAINQVLYKKEVRTPDLGGTHTTMEMAHAIVKELKLDEKR